jgi:hypothetical protein
MAVSISCINMRIGIEPPFFERMVIAAYIVFADD